MAFIHKHLVFVYKQEDQLNGVKVIGYSGDTEVLAQAVMKHGDNVVQISKILQDGGNIFEKIEAYNDTYSNLKKIKEN